MSIVPHPMIPNAVLAHTLLIVCLFAPIRAKLPLNDEEPIGNIVPGLAYQSEFTFALHTLFHLSLLLRVCVPMWSTRPVVVKRGDADEDAHDEQHPRGPHPPRHPVGF